MDNSSMHKCVETKTRDEMTNRRTVTVLAQLK